MAVSFKSSFLFFHYGEFPGYLHNAIEHVRIFNPDSDIILVNDSFKQFSALNRFNITYYDIKQFNSPLLDSFRRSYRHISSYNEKYEKFCFERWFVSEIIRKASPEKVYVLIDSDVATFGNVSSLLESLPKCPISISGCSPHFSFIRESIDDFLNFILDFYSDDEKVNESLARHNNSFNSTRSFNLTDNAFLPLFMQVSRDVQNYNLASPLGFIDTNIHVPQEFDFLQLRRRQRKSIFWRMEQGRAIPYFKRDNEFVRAFILHFQGPGKRVFHRFNSLDGSPSEFQIWWWNQIFQKRWLANLM